MDFPRLRVCKKYILDAKGHFRFFDSIYNPVTKEKFKAPLYHLETLNIVTEKQFCDWIYKIYGPGEYLVKAWKNGHKGVWIFWRGIINEEGFMFYQKQNNSTKAINKLKDKLAVANDEDERAMIIEDINLEKEFKDVSNSQWYGFSPFLKHSGTRGRFILWDDSERVVEIPQQEQEWKPENKPIEVQHENWSGEEKKTRKQLKESFDVW